MKLLIALTLSDVIWVFPDKPNEPADRYEPEDVTPRLPGRTSTLAAGSSVPCPLPRRIETGARVGAFPVPRGLPRISGGSASATSLSRPAQASLALRPAGSPCLAAAPTPRFRALALLGRLPSPVPIHPRHKPRVRETCTETDLAFPYHSRRLVISLRRARSQLLINLPTEFVHILSIEALSTASSEVPANDD